MKPKKYTALYLYEIIYPILFCIAIIAMLIYFYIRLRKGTENVAPSSIVDLIAIPIFIALIAFIILYMYYRFITFNDNGVYYKDLRKSFFIDWKNVNYIKITLNGNQKIGIGSYIVISSDQYTLQYTDFRATREDFIVLRYRRSALNIIKKNCDGVIVKASAN